ncbi:unnamed protein product [Cyclocybe aegerita]|uniref:Uncharacterized protein n=1 Tax=Cyclocybe aegerita TaxID=1973307 RepID=A0A8S0WC35_CYCAE|nr:unnamed protein product [Cyclocybe aegerita]
MPSKDPPPDEPLWTEAETLILMAHLEAFVKGDKCSRKELLISTVLPKMKKHCRDMVPEQWKHRKLQIKWWFYNHKEPDKTDFDLGWKTHLKTIISHLWGEELHALASECCSHDSSSQPFFKMYLTVYADFHKSMTPEQNRQAKEAQRTWEVQHPPELQYKNVGLHLEKVLLSVAKMLYHEFGMTVIIDLPAIDNSSHDFSKTVGVNCPEKSFTDLHPTLIDQFKKALIKQMSYKLLQNLEVPSDEETGTESQVPTCSSTPSGRQLPHLQCDPHGYPFLPPLLPGGESTPQQ